jgi:MoxR-like ATPase
MSTLSYRKIFDPKEVDRDPATEAGAEPTDEQLYVFANDTDKDTTGEQMVLAINAAIVTQRPLLIYGPPGSGKSSLAPNIARILGIPFHSHVVTSRTEVRDLLWRFDAVRRLSDARAGGGDDRVGIRRTRGGLRDDKEYIQRGVLWDAFDTLTSPPRQGNTDAPSDKPSSVVLLDEIDKADPDLPNGLLVPLGSHSFPGPNGRIIRPAANPPLVVITSNNERELSAPFLRRCITLTLKEPTEEHLIKVAKARFKKSKVTEDKKTVMLKDEKSDLDIYEQVAHFVVNVATTAETQGLRQPSTAEYLDAVRSCKRLGIVPEGDAWKLLSHAVLIKSDTRA